MNKTRILAKAHACDTLIEVFTLVLGGGDSNIQEAADILCDMPPADLRTLRETLARIDGMLDVLALDRHLKRD